MTLECPKCKSPVAREGQRFCYRCGHELNAYYDSLKIKVSHPEPDESLAEASSSPAPPPEAGPPVPDLPVSTVVLQAHAFDSPNQPSPETPPKASVKILLPTGDVFDRELTNAETQIGKGPRNDIVIADPAVSTAHAMIRLEGTVYTINDIGSRNGTYVNSERVNDSRQLNHGDVIGIGLSKLTFLLGDHGDTAAIEVAEIARAARPAQPPPLTEESLAAAVVNAGLVTRDDVDRVRGNAKVRLYQALITERLASEETLRDLMSKTFQMPALDLTTTPIDEKVVAEFPPKLAREHQVFAVARQADSLILALADPTNSATVEQLKRELRSPLSINLATASQIREQVDKHYGPRLIGVLPSGEKLEYLIDKHEVEIGKASHNHIVLTDPTVSNTHAIVLSRDAGYTIVDLGSRNGTFVNGERLGAQAHTFRHGDRVQLGQTVLTFRNPGETTANITAVLSGEALEEIRRRARSTSLEDAKGEIGEAKRPDVASVETGPSIAAAPPELSPSPAGAPAIDGSDKIAEAATPEDEKGERKKKKKKKKGGDERLKAAYISGMSRIVAQVMGVILAVLLALYVNSSMRSGSEKPVIETSSKGKAKVKLAKATAGTPFQGETFEASGVVSVPDANGVLIVDDNRIGEVLWMEIDESGRQVGPVKPIPLGVTVEDPEGITSDGSYFYIIGSQSNPDAGERNALVRFTFDAASQTVQKAEALTNLRDFLIGNVPELRNADLKGSQGGLNIEGITWDFKRARWLLGLRSPLAKDESALIVAIKLKNPAGPFSADNLQLAEPNAVPLKLAGLGIRDIQYDPESNSFLIISGAPEHHEKTEFTLWEWNGSVEQSGSESPLRKEQDLDPKMKPEGITHVEIRGRKFLFLVCDASVYLKLDYAEAQ